MIFAFAEDGMVAVLDDLAAARRECGAVDVESGAFVFYAEDGTWLRPRFVVPNRRRFFGWTQGEYVLDPEPAPPAGVDPFDVALDAAVDLQPNGYFASLDAVRGHVATRRAHLAHDGRGP